MLVAVLLAQPVAAIGAPQPVVQDSGEQQYLIFGEVYDGKSSQPLDGAVVKVSEQGVHVNTTATSPTGYFSVGVPNGTYRIEISKNGYELWFLFPVTIIGAAKSLGKLALEPKDGGAPAPSQGGGLFSLSSSGLLLIGALIAVVIFGIAGALLFSRISKSQVLEHQRRKQIFEHLQANPGIHFRKVMQDLKVGSGVLSHHLHTLEREGLVTSKRNAGKRVFYPIGVRMEVPKDVKEKIVDEVKQAPGITQAEVATKLNISRMLAHYHVRSLVEEKRIRVEHDDNGRVSMYADPTGGWYNHS
ncbi:MAG TPA: winged helix-turn-helix transcriptional regulator [Thermoplasmata archaeon]|nr:winged helix-turn-helix transcriptional regulator [Thermoplasmata archaeon]